MVRALILAALVACNEQRTAVGVEAGAMVASPAPVDAVDARVAPSVALPAGFADLPKATRVHVMDEWSGLAGRRAVFARLERSGDGFSLSALLAADDDAVQDPVPDPTVVRPTPNGRCRVYGPSYECLERIPPSMPTPKRAFVAAVSVEAFLAEVAKRGIDPRQDHPTGDVGTDDSPHVHVTVWLPGYDEPIHLSFADNREHWRVNGAFLGPDPDLVGTHPRLNAAYRAMARAMGVDAASLFADRARGP